MSLVLLVGISMLFTACGVDDTQGKKEESSDISKAITEDKNAPEEKTVKDIEHAATPTPEIDATNPILWADVPDPDVIRVGEYYYMVSTTMHLSPGVPIMRSTNLVNWEIISYVYDVLAEDDKHNLVDGMNVYGKGSWAASIRYHEEMFYVCFASYDRNRTYIYKTADIEQGSWEKVELTGVYHDPSLLFDDGHVYIVYGSGAIKIKELEADVSGIMQGGVDQVLVSTAKEGNIVSCEGSHIMKIKDTYYLFLIEWPRTGTSRRIEWCYRSKELLGAYEGKVVLDDNFSFGNNGVAQGGIVDTPKGDWYAVLFQDHGAVGRIPIMVPVTWCDGWPMMGVEGKVTSTLDVKLMNVDTASIVTKDEFDYTENKLKLQWQWNHNPDNTLWSVTERSGYLRLTTGNVVTNILSARNTLSQRTMGPIFVSETKLDTVGMKAGDYAGIAAFQNGYGMLGVKVAEDGTKSIMLADNDGTGNPKEQFSIPLTQDEIYLKINFIFNFGAIKSLTTVDKAYFYYSIDGVKWDKIDYALPMKYTLDHFMGYRSALYCYATKQTGGYADFDYYHYANTLDEK